MNIDWTLTNRGQHTLTTSCYTLDREPDQVTSGSEACTYAHLVPGHAPHGVDERTYLFRHPDRSISHESNRNTA